MFYEKKTKIICICCLLTSFFSVSAQSRLDSLQHIEEVIVTGTRPGKEVIPEQTLSSVELKKLSVHSVADAIRYFSGVQIKDFGGIGGLKTVNIRSMGTQHVGVFYDGIELGNAQNGTVDLGRFSLDNMESITLYNGQKSAIFQPAKDFGSAGSIYMTSRTPQLGEGENDNIRVKVKSGSFGIINPSIQWEHQLNKAFSSSFNAEYLYTTGRYKFSYSKADGYDTSEVRKNGDVSALRIESGLFRKIENGEWKVKAYLYNSERGYPGASVREEPGKFKHQDRQWDRNLFLQTSLKKNYNTLYSMLLSGKYAYDYLHYLSDPRLDVSTMYVNNHYHQQEVYLSSANQFSLLPFWKASLSADVQFNTLNADLYDFVYPIRYTGLVAAATAFHFDRFKLQTSVLGTFVHEKTRTGTSAAPDKNKYTPAIFVSWQPWKKEELSFRAFFKRVFRMPTLNDLYYTFIGNKDLNPEYTNQYNIGVTWSKDFNKLLLERIEIQADVYYNEVTDKIIAMPTSNQFRWTMVNLGFVEIRGIDISVQNKWNFREDFSLNARVNYTYQKAQDFTDLESNYYGGQIPYIPWHSGSFIFNGSYRDWDLNYSFIYTGERYESQANIIENHALPWYTSDVSTSRFFYLKGKEMMITVEVNNLFNQQYEVVQSYPMPGINFKIILNVTIL